MEKIIESIKAKLRKKAVVLNTGGIRPTHQFGESWVGKVCWQNSGEEQPLGRNGLPMTPLATIFVPESDYVPKALKNIKLINIFVDNSGREDFYEDDYKDNFVIRLPFLKHCEMVASEGFTKNGSLIRFLKIPMN